MRIDVFQKTISNDLAWLRKDVVAFVTKNRENMAFEYKQALSNFYQLRKEAWKQFYSTQSETVKTNLYAILESLSNNIISLTAAGDIIEQEVLAESANIQRKQRKRCKNWMRWMRS